MDMQLFQISEPGENPNVEPQNAQGILGIDLGTTNSIIAIHDGQKTICIEDPAVGSSIVPSVVAFEQNSVLVGSIAKDEVMKFSSIKRFMGKTLEELGTDCIYRTNPESGTIEFFSSAGYKSPVEISSEILKHLKNLAEKQLGYDVSKVVITVPAYFDERARAATRDAAKLAGLEVIRIINEPTAAAIAYGFGHDRQGTYAVYDFGGGTFDVSILKMRQGVLQVLATKGDTRLGGDDIDAILANIINEEVGAPDDEIIKDIKHTITEEKSWEGIVNSKPFSITREEFESAIHHLVERTMKIFESAIEDSGVKISDIDEVILVGGSTRIPLVKKLIADFYGKNPLDSLDPDLTVAIGAAIQADNLRVVSDNLLLDVTPLSLKIEVADGLTETIIYRNSPIPFEKNMTFTTQRDGQTGYIVHILQGEGDKIKDCRSLARFELKGIPPMKSGEARLSVSFRIDADGLLSVLAQETSSGVANEIMVNPSYGLKEVKIKKLLNLQ